MRITADYPPVWLAGAIAAAWGLARTVPGGIGGWAFWPGCALVAAGLALMLAAVAEMARARTTIVPHEVPSALVTSGVFRFTRNPIYLGDALVLSGLILAWDVAAALPLIVLLVWVIELRFIRPEEARLRAAFGADFDRWATRVRRWV